MAVGIVDRQKLVDIADAVRAKKGITGNMTLDAIASNITSMPTADNNAKFDFAVSKSSGKLVSHLTKIDLSGWDTSNVTSMTEMFKNCSSLTSLDVSGFNTSKVTGMISMFQDCSSLTSLDLSNWNTSKVTSNYCMFYNCESLTTLDLRNFDTSNIIDIFGMFSNCSSLTSLDVSGFNTSKVTNMSDMFQNCKSLTTLDLSNWNTSKVTSMGSMFFNCYKLSNLTLGNDWASNSSISSFSLSSCPLTHESTVDVINKLATRSNSPVITFNDKVALYQSEIDVATNKGWSVSGCSVLVDAETATKGQFTLIDGEVVQCVYVADEPQAWGQRIFFYDSNIGESRQWGGYGTSTGITDTAIGTGLSNTNALIAMNLQSTNGTPTVWDAVTEFRSTHSDRWFVPSKEELGKIINSYSYSYIWSSTELNANYAYRSNPSYNPNTIEHRKSDTNSIYVFTYV